jgi:hypothetical protein
MEFGAGTTGDIIAPDHVILGPSDYAYIDLYVMPDNGVSFFLVGTLVDPPMTEPPDFTFNEVIPGPGTYYDTPYAPSVGIGEWISNLSQQFYPYVYGTDKVVLATLVIHCTGAPSIHTITYNADIFGTAGQFVSDVSLVDYTDIDWTLPAITIEQIPEPASLALLALGGLALIRRR